VKEDDLHTYEYSTKEGKYRINTPKPLEEEECIMISRELCGGSSEDKKENKNAKVD